MRTDRQSGDFLNCRADKEVCAPTSNRLFLAVAAAVTGAAIAARAAATVLGNFTHNSHLLSLIDSIGNSRERQPNREAFWLAGKR